MKFSIILILICAGWLQAAGPTKVATFNRALWPKSLNSEKNFDEASRHELMVYINQVSRIECTTLKQVRNFTHIQKVNLASVQKWKTFIKSYLLKNMQAAQKSCSRNEPLCQKVSNWEQLTTMTKKYHIEPALSKWHKASKKFFSYYMYEQVRLAALFPRITSEIDTLDSSEVQGYDFKDKSFLLTFDDGPSYTKTKMLSELLAKNHLNGLFFVLGNQLQKSIKKEGLERVKALYSKQCIGSHGYIHKPHPKLKNWETLYDKTKILIEKVDAKKRHKTWFRPPYGQRNLNIIQALKKKGDRVMLWNIDSQDWNRKLSAKEVEDRVVTLMLVHRKGIILFHDIHNKAIQAIQNIRETMMQKSVRWLDCHLINP